jgi:small conductance mechanosensitive channel
MEATSRRILYGLTGLALALVAAGILLYYVVAVLHLIPISYALAFHLLLALVFGLVAVTLGARLIRRLGSRFIDPRRLSLLLTTYELVAYVVLALILLAVAGVNGYALLTGGTFAGLVLGLAGQTILSNLMGGVMLLFTRPLKPGERVTILAWQYNLLAPTYSPKFYSEDYLIPGYTGVVEEIGLVYTRFRMDDGTHLRLPNGILIQAGVFSHEVDRRWVRTKYEIPAQIPVRVALDRVASRVRECPWVVDSDSVRVLVNQATRDSYVVSVDALCRGNMDDPPRSAILMILMETVQNLRSAGPPGPGGTAVVSGAPGP